MKTWPVFLKYQNASAYGEGHSNPSPASTSQLTEAARYFASIEAKGRKNALLVGAGSMHEVAALVDVLPPVTLLTAHAPEAEMFLRNGCWVVQSDMHDTPIATASFDIVFSATVLEHAIAPYVALMEVRRILRPGGIGYFIMPSFEGDEGGVGPFHLHCLDERVWMELLRKCGLRIADVYPQPSPAPTTTKTYTHYRCVAEQPPWPSDGVLQDLISFKATQ